MHGCVAGITTQVPPNRGSEDRAPLGDIRKGPGLGSGLLKDSADPTAGD